MLFILPPWHVTRILFSKNSSGPSVQAKLFLCCWICAQWLLFLSSGSSLIINLLIANWATLVFLIANPFAYVDFDNAEPYRLRGQKHSFIASICVAFASIVLMYGVAEIPNGILMGWRRVHLQFVSYDFHWTAIHKIAAWILVSLWIIFTMIDRYAIFSVFPKYNFFKEEIREETKQAVTCYVLFFYIAATIYSATRLGKWFLF